MHQTTPPVGTQIFCPSPSIPKDYSMIFQYEFCELLFHGGIRSDHNLEL